MVWEQRLEAFRNAVLRASERNPQIVFAIRGMHPSYVEWSTNHAVVGDVQAQFFLRMLNRILEPVKNKVSFRNIIIIFTHRPWEGLKPLLFGFEWEIVKGFPDPAFRTLLLGFCSSPCT